MKRIAATLLVIATISSVAACQSDSATTTSSETTASYAESPSTVEPTAPEISTQAKTPRGNVPKQIGEQGSLVDTDTGQPFFTFTVNEIVPGYQCQGPYPPTNMNGQFLAVKITLTTGPDLTQLTTPPTLPLSESDWQIVGVDGVLESGTDVAQGCAPDNESWPQNVGPNVTVNATFVLDTKNANGFLVFAPWFGDGGGWEYTF